MLVSVSVKKVFNERLDMPGLQTPAEFTSRIQAETAQLKRALEKLKIQPE